MSRLRGVLAPLLIVAGLGFITSAAWVVALPAGLAAAGISCWILEWLITSDGP